MRWARRSWRVSHGLMSAWIGLVAAGVQPAMASDADTGAGARDDTESAAWLVALPESETEAPWRQDPLLGEASLALVDPDSTRVSVVFVRFEITEADDRETVIALAQALPYDLWLLEERADLSYIPRDGASGDADITVRRYEIARRRLPRLERRLHQHVSRVRADGRSAMVVLQGEGPDPTQLQIAVVESASKPATAAVKLAGPSADRGTARGRLRATGPTPPGGLLGALLVRDEPAAPLPLTAEAAPSNAPVPPVTPVPSAPLEPEKEPADEPRTTGIMAAEPLAPIAPEADDRAADDRAADNEATTRDAIAAAVEAWADAWSRQDIDAYLGAYSSAFRPSGHPIERWRRNRRERIGRPDWIEVTVESMTIETLDDGMARARFDQRYRSDRYRDRVEKRLDLTLENGRWRIARERVIRALPSPNR